MPSAGVVVKAAGAAAATGGARKPATATASRPPTSIDREQVLGAGGGAQAGDVEEGERDHDHGGPEGARRRAEREHRRHVIAENEGEQGDRPAVDHRRPCPCVQETRVATERPRQKIVVAARVRIGGGEFGVAERARQRHDGAQDPRHDEPADVAGDARHHRRRLVDAGADDDADDDRDRVGGTQQRPRCRRRDGVWGTHGLAPPAQRLLPVSAVFRSVGQRAGHA